MRRTLLVFVTVTALAAIGVVAAPAASAPSFASERLVGSPADDNWEPTTAADPHAPWVYQAVTAINDQCASHDCSIYSILIRASGDGGVTWGPLVPVCGLACKNVPWQFDPQLRSEERRVGKECSVGSSLSRK